jgi:hypothetical protein
MPDAAYNALLPAREVARTTPLASAANGLHYASFGYTEVPSDSLKQIVEAVPPAVAAALGQHAYYFVPLAIGETAEPGDTEIARGFTLDLGDRATCHRNLTAEGRECTFISARLMQDRFALAFEFFINIGHQLVDAASVPKPFQDLLWSQARTGVRGETSQDAYEARTRALAAAPSNGTAEPHNDFAAELNNSISLFAAREPQAPRASAATTDAARTRSLQSIRPETEQPTEEQLSFFEAAFADALAIYMLSLAMDLDYGDLREREYPLLAAPALAERLRLAADLFPPAPGYEFAIRYRRRR